MPTPQACLEKFEQKLTQLYQCGHLPSELISVIDQVSRLQIEYAFNIKADDFNAPMPPLCEAQKHVLGMPLLPKANYIHASGITHELLDKIMQVLSALPQPMPILVEGMREHLKVDEYCRDLFCDRVETAPPAKEGGFSPSYFLRFALLSALAPSINYLTREAAKKHDGGMAWNYGHCPICGSMPLMHYGLPGAQNVFAACSFCNYEYMVPRNLCPVCNSANIEQNELQSADKTAGPEYYFSVCADCGHYIKIAEHTRIKHTFIAPLDDLCSLSLDLAARQMDFSRISYSAWSF